MLASPSVAGAENQATGARQRHSARVAVVGGQPADPGTFPWMAFVLDRNGDRVGQCSGTVVAPNLILTAGHCAENTQTGAVDEASGYRVVTGNVNWAASQSERQVSGVSRVILCSCYDRHTAVGDVALLELSTPTTAPAVALASSPGAGAAARLAGWGKEYFKQDALVERLQWAPTVVQRPSSCEYEASPFSPQSEICTVDLPKRSTGACEGDSGGPLLVPGPSAAGGMVQIGVASHVYGGCSTAKPSVFTRVDAIAAWVRGWAQALASPASPSTQTASVATPTLAGIATIGGVTFRRGAISLALACDREGGVCAGNAEANIVVRERFIARRSRRTVSKRTFTVTLASVSFAMAPGASTLVRASLSPRTRTLLSRLGGRPLGVFLTGRGVAQRIIPLQPSGR